MNANPNQKLIIIDPFNLFSKSLNYEAQVYFGKLSKFNLVKPIHDFKTVIQDIKEAIEELISIEKKLNTSLSGTSFKVTQTQQEYAERILAYLQHDLPKCIKEE
jgi:hypothetical protein